MENLINYITHSFGIRIIAEPIPGRELGQLPLYLKGSFSLFKGQLEGRDLLWAKVLQEDKVTPDRLRNQKVQLKKWFPQPVVFVFDHLDAWQRSRFIDKKIGFVQIGKQLYIPEMFLQLSDLRSQNVRSIIKKESLSFPAQCTVLFHLQNSPLDEVPLLRIAELLEYSAMTVSRIVKELQGFKLVTVHDGKEKQFRFNHADKDLWEQVYPLLRTPVKEVWRSEDLPPFKNLLAAGETALAQFSMLSEGDAACFAMGKQQFRSLKAGDGLQYLNKKHGDYRIEVWNYDPGIIVGENKKRVDKLSLYLSMSGSEDERVKAALDEALNSIKW